MPRLGIKTATSSNTWHSIEQSRKVIWITRSLQHGTLFTTWTIAIRSWHFNDRINYRQWPQGNYKEYDYAQCYTLASTQRLEWGFSKAAIKQTLFSTIKHTFLFKTNSLIPRALKMTTEVFLDDSIRNVSDKCTHEEISKKLKWPNRIGSKCRKNIGF